MLVWKFLHIASMFFGGAFLFAYEIVFHRAVHRGNREAVASLASQRTLIDNVGVGLIVAGIAFGLLTALTGGFDLTAPWLIIAYVLLALIMVVGAGPETAYAKRLAAAAEAGPDEFEAARRDPRRNLAWLSGLLYGAVILDMVVKPFS